MVKKRIDKSKKQFAIHGQEIVNYLREQSPQNAEKFKEELSSTLIKIKKSPKAYPPEPYLPTKNNLYRFALVMKSWKIIFKITGTLLVFLGIIHTARHPKEIKKLRTRNYD
jgi:plasmid stabilization system protein ParE